MLGKELEFTKDICSIYKVIKEDSSTSFFLDSSQYDEELGRYSMVGWKPRAILRSKGRKIEYWENDEWSSWEADPLQSLEKLRKEGMDRLGEYESIFPFAGGLVGYISYDMKKNIEKLDEKCIDDLRMYEQYWGIYDNYIVKDHLEDKLWMISLDHDKLKQMEEEIREKLARKSELQEELWTGPIESNFTRDEYIEAIKEVQEHIRQGDIYQVNLSQRFTFALKGSRFKFYEILRKTSPAYFGAFMHFPEYDILSISPERYIRKEKSYVETRPIKGTRPRGKNPEEDKVLYKELKESSKDQAELLMIVDLERNDLGRVCETGSVRVEDLFKISSYATVFHLDAKVMGTMGEDCGIDKLLKGTYPGGSITGAPKIMAMNIIEKLEPTARGVYTGSIGYINYNGDCDLNIAIRTAIVKGEQAYYQAGGGLTTCSDPELEYEETYDKTRALILAKEEVEKNADFSRGAQA